MFFNKLDYGFYSFKQNVSNNIEKILEFISRFETPCLSFMSSSLIGMTICLILIKIGEITVIFIFPNYAPMLVHYSQFIIPLKNTGMVEAQYQYYPFLSWLIIGFILWKPVYNLFYRE